MMSSSHAHSCSYRGLPEAGEGHLSPPELDAAHTFYILRVRDGEERKQGGGHKQGYLHIMVNLKFHWFLLMSAKF